MKFVLRCGGPAVFSRQYSTVSSIITIVNSTKMSHIDTEELRKEIAEILKDADLANTSAKKVRLELQTKLDVDLTARRKEIDQLVMDYVNSREDTDEEEAESESEPEQAPPAKKKKKKASSEEEEEPKPKKAAPKKKSGKKKKKGSDSDSDSDWDKKAKAVKTTKTGRSGGNGYTRAYKLSPALAELMGQESMARHEVVKRVWAIIKERQLYDENNKQFAICDDALYKVFGCKRFRTFGMMKYLKTHFHD